MAYILYEGPSVLDGAPIVVIMTGVKAPSHNEKTGAMAQTYILRQDIAPGEAVKSKEDVSICGDCPHRGTSCYVNVAQGPTSVWRTYKRLGYNQCSPKKAGYNLSIRIGAYGDPGAVPAHIWSDLLSHARMWTGYTHQALSSPELKGNIQASADSPEEALKLQAAGWKTFRVKSEDEPFLPGEILCPNEKTGMQCIVCGLCDGRKKNIAINVHGVEHKIKKYKSWRIENGNIPITR